jgi:pimeloyl-ACP methyl ester carboxylesterase
VFGTSSGGSFALYLLIRHSDAIRGAILHEPGLYAVLDDFEAVRAPVRAVIAGAMQAGGPSVAVEALWDYIAGDNAWDQLSSELRERLRATAATLFSIELGSYELSLPDNEMLARIGRPVRLLVSEQSLPFYNEIANRLAERFGWDVATTRGRHAPYHDCPAELAETIRPFLREVSAARR